MTNPLPNRTDRPDEFDVPTSPAQAGRFPNQAMISIRLRPEAAGRYQVFRKDIPEDAAGKTYNDKEVTWLNNFGLKERGKGNFSNRVTSYYILIPRIKGAQAYVYYDGSAVQPLDTRDDPDGSSRVMAELDRGDPAIGWI